VKHGLVTLVVIMIFKDTATFQVLFIVSLFCARDAYFRSPVEFRTLTESESVIGRALCNVGRSVAIFRLLHV